MSLGLQITFIRNDTSENTDLGSLISVKVHACAHRILVQVYFKLKSVT